MLCIKCQKENTKCVDDMLQIHYIAEIYKCMDCKGTIEVVYDREISKKKIKDYHYYVSHEEVKPSPPKGPELRVAKWWDF